MVGGGGVIGGGVGYIKIVGVKRLEVYCCGRGVVVVMMGVGEWIVGSIRVGGWGVLGGGGGGG